METACLSDRHPSDGALFEARLLGELEGLCGSCRARAERLAGFEADFAFADAVFTRQAARIRSAVAERPRRGLRGFWRRLGAAQLAWAGAAAMMVVVAGTALRPTPVAAPAEAIESMSAADREGDRLLREIDVMLDEDPYQIWDDLDAVNAEAGSVVGS